MEHHSEPSWTDALRSGEYKQGTGVLCFQGRFCCMGVLCDIRKLEWSEDDEDYREWKFPKHLCEIGEHNRTCTATPQLLQPEFPDMIPECLEQVQSLLIWMNDCRYSFSEIADTIERLRGLTKDQQDEFVIRFLEIFHMPLEDKTGMLRNMVRELTSNPPKTTP